MKRVFSQVIVMLLLPGLALDPMIASAAGASDVSRTPQSQSGFDAQAMAEVSAAFQQHRLARAPIRLCQVTFLMAIISSLGISTPAPQSSPDAGQTQA